MDLKHNMYVEGIPLKGGCLSSRAPDGPFKGVLPFFVIPPGYRQFHRAPPERSPYDDAARGDYTLFAAPFLVTPVDGEPQGRFYPAIREQPREAFQRIGFGLPDPEGAASAVARRIGEFFGRAEVKGEIEEGRTLWDLDRFLPEEHPARLTVTGVYSPFSQYIPGRRAVSRCSGPACAGGELYRMDWVEGWAVAFDLSDIKVE